MGWGTQGRSNTNRYGDQEFRGQERFNEPSGGWYGQGGSGQGERWPSHRGDWGQGRIEQRGYYREDPFGDDSGGFSGGSGSQDFGQGQQYGGPGRFQQPRGPGFDQQGYRGQGQMSRQGDWNPGYGNQGGYSDQGGTGWGGRDQFRSQQGFSNQGPGQSQGDWGSSRQGWATQGYGSQGDFGGGQGRLGAGGTFTYTELWLIPGPHAGRGPRGYQRSGQRIEEDVCERLSQHGQLDASDIQVKVENGEVTLTGTVGSRQEKRMAEDALDTVPGIRDVHNQLRVQQDPSQPRGQATRTPVDRGGQGRTGKENANSSREKEPATAGAD
jgi:hypothetical protein